MRLDGDGRTSQGGKGFDDIRVERTLNQEPHVLSHLFRLCLEHVDEGMSNTAPLLLRVDYAGKPFQKPIAGIDDYQIYPQIPAEGLLDLLPLVQAQQPVVYEDAGK